LVHAEDGLRVYVEEVRASKPDAFLALEYLPLAIWKVTIEQHVQPVPTVGEDVGRRP
jgi:hypothetical protein